MSASARPTGRLEKVQARPPGWWLLALVGAACSSTPNILPNNDFARPTDMAFMCLGVAQTPAGEQMVTGRPMRDCHPAPSEAAPAATDMLRTFGFVPNSAAGGLSVIDADRWGLVDLDPANPGYGTAYVGTFPSQISVTTDGCRLVTANRGSADLTLVDPSILLTPKFQRDFPQTSFVAAPDPEAAIQRLIKPHGPDGVPIGAAPFEAMFRPIDTTTAEVTEQACPAAGTPSTRSWQALVTFPTCDLVALVDLPSGDIIDSLFVRASNGNVAFVPAGSSPRCESGTGGSDAGAAPGADAGAGADSGVANVDGGADDAGGTAAAADVAAIGGTTQPWSIQIMPNGDQAFVSLAKAAGVVRVDLNANSLSNPSLIALHENAIGSQRIRLSVDPFQYQTAPDGTEPAFPGRFVGQNADRQYLYVLALDGTVRVIDVASPATMQECETNFDPQTLPPGVDTNCVPIGGAIRRLPAATGPGIQLPSGIPVDVAVADIENTFTGTSTAIPDTQDNVSGAFAWVLSSSGLVYLVNIEPVLRTFPMVVLPPDPSVPNSYPETPAPFPNTLRDRNQVAYSAGMDPSSGPPRLDDVPNVPTGEPFIETFYARDTANNATALDVNGAIALPTPVYFPDRSTVTPQTWTVAWEGTLIQPRFAGHVDASASTLQDGVGFCDANVLPGDLVTLNGCRVDADCGSGTVCAIAEGTPEQGAGGLLIRGLCVDPNHKPDRTKSCQALLETVRRYEVVQSNQSSLTLRPHRDELVRSPFTPCRVIPAGAAAGAGTTDGGAGDAGMADNPANDCRDPNDSSTDRFTCELVDGGTPRCLNKCAKDSDCRAGRLCESGFCVEGPSLTPALQRCFDQLMTYEVDVGNGFLVSGSVAGVLPMVVNQQPTDPNQPRGCAVDNSATRDSRLISRIPIGVSSVPGAPTPVACASLPAVFPPMTCPKTSNTVTCVDFATDVLPPVTTMASDDEKNALTLLQTTPTPNPCFFLGQGSSDMPTGQHLRAMFENREIRFVMGDVERAPSTPIPIRFSVHGGFAAQSVAMPSSVAISMPARIVLTPVPSTTALSAAVGSPPAPYLMIVDQRRIGTSSAGGPTRGQLLRIDPFGFTATYGYQPLVEDYQHSGNLFPIQ